MELFSRVKLLKLHQQNVVAFLGALSFGCGLLRLFLSSCLSVPAALLIGYQVLGDALRGPVFFGMVVSDKRGP